MTKAWLSPARGNNDCEDVALEDNPGTMVRVKRARIGEKQQLIACFIRNQNVFAWSFFDISDIEPWITCHKFNLDSFVKPV